MTATLVSTIAAIVGFVLGHKAAIAKVVTDLNALIAEAKASIPSSAK